MSVYAKDPSSDVDYSIDWSAWLTDGETVTSAAWSVAPATGLQIGTAIDGGALQGTYVSGGVAGDRYRLTCRGTTSAGRTADRSLTIRVMEQ
ncbi:hypothetical protein [Kordiimonas marina]|uniref:phage fiber-tail adaptor protein n=1 Tax=Kordiimonas marina TaxID=2872312 RepID=UPI001FF3DDD4|nr:hypothetical protein [Kordiimonas marina]MCJ9428688.1 hypothetical protein [Kordiimonas marina]